MSCKQIPFAILMCLADGELRGLKALTVRRHLKRCKDCQQTLSEIGRVDTLLKSTDYFPVTVRQKSLPLRPIGLVSGIALAAGAALFFVMPGGPLRPSISFAQVEAAMGTIRAATWTVTFEGSGPKMSTATHWADLVQGRIATEQSDIGGGWGSYRSLYDGTNTLSFFPRRNLYMLSEGQFEDDAKKGATPQERVRKTVLFQQEKPDPTTKSTPPSDLLWSAWTSRQETLEGKTTHRFDRTATQQVAYNKIPKQYTLTEAVWVEPETYKVIRRETTVDHGEGKKRRMICSGYRYNETPPPGTFELPKPKLGVPYQFGDYTDKAVKRSSAALKGAEFAALQGVIQRAIAAWDRGDADGFVRECDFNEPARRQEFSGNATKQTPQQYADNLRWQWRSRVKNRDSYFSWKAPMLTNVHYTTDNIGYIRRSESESFPPQLPYETYVKARVLAQVRLKKDPSHVQELPTTFNLIKREGQWRIYWFNQWIKPNQWAGKTTAVKK